MRTNDIISALVLKNVKGLGAVAIKNLYSKGVFSNDNYFQTIRQGLEIANKQISDHELSMFIRLAEETIKKCEEFNIGILHLADKTYPQQLHELKDSPPILFYLGSLDRLDNVIGIIGTREPDPVATKIAELIGSHFQNCGFSICNGLAIGVDEASIRYNGIIRSNVVGALAGGLNFNQEKTLLKSTALVAQEVVENGGLIISEYEPGVKEDTFKTIKSCRIQAGLCHGLVLVQSTLNGGSKYTVETFSSLNRPLAIVSQPSGQNDPLYEANAAILTNYREGLAKMTGVKPDKIKQSCIYKIASKDDYAPFELAIKHKPNLTAPTGSLFN